MSTTLNYASPDTARTWRAGIGYYALVVVNLLALGLGISLIPLGHSGDGYYSQLGVIFIGGILAVAQLLLGGLPSWIYLFKNGSRMSGTYKVSLLSSILPPPTSLIAMIVAFNTPATHGGC